jgi:hypothetical protein
VSLISPKTTQQLAKPDRENRRVVYCQESGAGLVSLGDMHLKDKQTPIPLVSEFISLDDIGFAFKNALMKIMDNRNG